MFNIQTDRPGLFLTGEDIEKNRNILYPQGAAKKLDHLHIKAEQQQHAGRLAVIDATAKSRRLAIYYFHWTFENGFLHSSTGLLM